MLNVLLSILLHNYANDMALIANSEKWLQAMQSVIKKWCKKWRLNINPTKSNIVHFRSTIFSRTNLKFWYGTHELLKVDKYKYLGVIFHELLMMQTCIETLSDSGSCALLGIIMKFKILIIVFNINLIVNYLIRCWVPILNYRAEIWGCYI